LLLLDSDVVITCHEFGIWEDIKAKFDVHVTSIVATVEVQFAKTSAGTVKIDLSKQAERGEITIVEATAPEMAAVTNLFTNSFAQGIDDGETEGLAVMSRGEFEDCKFCTGDTNSIQAVGMLALGDRSISFEEVLGFAGIQVPSPHKLPPHFSQRNRDLQVKTGSARRITGECFRRSPLGLH
jgi:hypothetical protein